MGWIIWGCTCIVFLAELRWVILGLFVAVYEIVRVFVTIG